MVWASIEKRRSIRVRGKRKNGRPKLRWLDKITNDLSERIVRGGSMQDLVKWRRLIRNIDPT